MHLSSPPILGHPIHMHTFIVYTDASATGLGAILAQRASQLRKYWHMQAVL